MNKYIIYIALLLLSISLFCSCGTTRNVMEGEYLLNGVNIVSDNSDVKVSELDDYLRQRPNSKILGLFKFHLWLYNRSTKEGSYWHRLGKAPVIYNPSLTEKTINELKGHLANIGYYNAVVQSEVAFKNSRANLIFNISPGVPYRLGSFDATIKDTLLQRMYDEIDIKIDLEKGGRLDALKLDKIRESVAIGYRDRGFYNFTKEPVAFIADTLSGKDSVALEMTIGLDSRGVSKEYSRFIVDQYFIRVGSVDDFSEGEPDTISIDNYHFISKGLYSIKPKVIIDALHIDNGVYYSQLNVERSYTQLSKLRQFKVVDISFEESREGVDRGDVPEEAKFLNCKVRLIPNDLQAFSVELEGTNTSGSLGVGVGGGYKHNNLFGGGEIFDISLSSSIERQRYGEGDTTSLFNTLMYSVETDLTVPKFVFPFAKNSWFKYEVPSTQMSFLYNYQNRPDFTRTIVGAGVTYNWNSNKMKSHSVMPLDVNVVRMLELDSTFLASIENLSIKSSYTNHSISAFKYSYTYSSQNSFKDLRYTFVRLSAESAGNILYGYSKLFNREQEYVEDNGRSSYLLFGTPFAQYLKFDAEARRGWSIDKVNNFIVRAYAGVAVPYLNSDQMPFERKFFSGGANSVRGWGVRTLGPGTYKADPSEFPNQTGDIKLEFNGEYRFSMVGYLEGAIFLDVGNCWSLDDNREGANFNFNSFYKEFAVSPGVGFRLDFDYAVMRLDLGVKSRDPSEPEGSRWVFGNREFNGDLVQWNFAIGYPF